MLFLRLTFILIISTFANLAFAKSLPPGSGNSIPANILFLVDKSNSMFQPADGQDAKGANMKGAPIDVAGNSNGYYFAAMTANMGINYWDPFTDRWITSDSTFGKNNGIVLTDKSGNLDYTKSIDTFGDYIYAVVDRSHTKTGSSSALMSIKKNKKDENRFFVAKANSSNGTFKDSNAPKDMRNKGQATMFYGVGAMTINQNTGKLLYITSRSWTVITLNGHLSSGNWIKCNVSSSTLNRLDDAIDVVRIGTEDYLFSKDGVNGNFYKYKLNSSGCPVGSSLYSNQKDIECGKGRGDSIVYNNGYFYTTGYNRHKICKYKDNGSTASLIKSAGVSEGYKTDTSGNANPYLYYPRGIEVGNGNATDQNLLYVANSERLEITVLKKDDLSFVRSFGNRGVSRITGAKDAIKSVLSDSSILSQAQFGLGLWNGGKVTFSGFNKSGGVPIFNSPLNPSEDAYMAVGINPKGTEQILSFLSSDFALHYGTHAQGFADLANKYFNYTDLTVNPHNSNLDCQTTAIILIGDGEWKDDTHRYAKGKIRSLFRNKKIITYSVGYGSDVVGKSDVEKRFREIAEEGGTEGPDKKGFFVAQTPEDLKAVTNSIVREIISKTVAYSAPSISAEVLSEGELYQAKFQNRNTKEWWGTIIKTELASDGEAYSGTTSTGDGFKWNAAKQMKNPDNRKIWTALPGADYQSNWNNFNVNNVSEIRGLFEKTGNQIQEYHSKLNVSAGRENLLRCKNNSLVRDGTNNDEDKGLINFIRGEDYFDYDGDCNLDEYRTIEEKTKSGGSFKGYIADIYNSQLVTVGVPSARRSSEKINEEGYFRAKNNYSAWADNNTPRREVIYAAANNGILHAFATDTGEELWGFVPPLVIPKMPKMINPNYNQDDGGGSNPLFLLDGSITVHDTYFYHPVLKRTDWFTLLMVTYGRGGAGFTLLDVTNPFKPYHIYSVLNDPVAQKVFHASENGTISEFSYNSNRASIIDFKESDDALTNKESGTLSTCDSTGTTSCYKGKKWTLIGQTINKTNLTIIADGIDVTATTSLQNLNGNTIFTFSKDYLFDTLGETRPSPVPNSTISIIQIGDIASGGEDYDYRFLGETWSSPRVIRMPNNGRGDKDIMDDEYVAVMAGGYGYPYPKIGSNVYIIDWLTGKIKKRIDIEDVPNDIVNSLPSTPVVVSARNSGAAEYTGALVYLSDLEGKITKINLTNMEFDYEYDPTDNTLKPKPSFLDLYDQTTLINLEANRLFNNRFMYHSLEAGIGARYNKLWLYGGTGDYLNLNDVMVNPSSVDNLMFGIKDVHFPYFGEVKDALTADNLTNCKDTTTDSTGANCPENADLGWYIKLTDRKKVVAEPTLSDNIVYYPIYKPTSKNNLSCGSGDAYICAADAECGTNISSRFPGNPNNHKGEECYYVGTGVLSKLVIHGSKIYANITEQSQNPNKDDLVVIESLSSGVVNYRSSWRENF